jgi:predicted TIM-barrel fold metal-dependent hydrolase
MGMLERMVFLLSIVLGLILVNPVAAPSAPKAQNEKGSTQSKLLQALAALEPIDTHTHVAKSDASFYQMLDRLHMHILDILLVDDQEQYRKAIPPQLEDAWRVVRDSHGHAALCTSFDPFQFAKPGFPESAIRGLNRDFADGAVAVKIWKNIGMELKDRNGHYVLADNAAFEPIYRDIQEHKKTLVAHQAEPDEAWEVPNPSALDYSYYQEHRFWYMYNKPDAPKKQQILDARDHVLAMNPKLRVVGAHLGSMEDDLDGLAKRFDRYPNFATDTAARVVHLAVQPSEKVRAFILKYQDRLVYGTDLGVAKDASIPDEIEEWQDQYARDWRYFATRDTFEYEGHKTQGLGLPPTVLRKLYHANAVDWIPGILATH